MSKGAEHEDWTGVRNTHSEIRREMRTRQGFQNQRPLRNSRRRALRLLQPPETNAEGSECSDMRMGHANKRTSDFAMPLGGTRNYH